MIVSSVERRRKAIIEFPNVQGMYVTIDFMAIVVTIIILLIKKNNMGFFRSMPFLMLFILYLITKTSIDQMIKHWTSLRSELQLIFV